MALADTAAAETARVGLEDGMALLRLWPNLKPDFLQRQPLLLRRLASAVAEALPDEAASWRQPPEPIAAGLIWLARQGSADIMAMAGKLLSLLPRVLIASTPAAAAEVLASLARTRDPEVWGLAREILQDSSKASDAAESWFVELTGAGPSVEVLQPSEIALVVAALGMDGPPINAWLGTRLTCDLGAEEVAGVCWACAELQLHEAAALKRAQEHLSEEFSASERSASTAAQRLLWAKVALGDAGATSGPEWAAGCSEEPLIAVEALTLCKWRGIHRCHLLRLSMFKGHDSLLTCAPP